MIDRIVKGVERYARAINPVRAYDDMVYRGLRCAI